MSRFLANFCGPETHNLIEVWTQIKKTASMPCSYEQEETPYYRSRTPYTYVAHFRDRINTNIL